MKSPLDRINDGNPLLKLSELGHTPHEIKELIVSTLSPYFENQEILKNTDVGLLAIEGVNVGKISITTDGDKFLSAALKNYRSAYAVDPVRALDVIASWEIRIQNATNEFWNQCLFEVDKIDLSLERFRFEVFRNIGSITEACIQPYLREGLVLNAMYSQQSNSCFDESSMTFGTVVRKYSYFFDYDSFLSPAPWKILLSDWRNIAQHHSSRVKDDKIVATYGKIGREQSVILSRDQLLDLLREISHRLSILKAARNIFMWDHIDEFSSRFEDIEAGEDTVLFTVSSAMASQGFQTIEQVIEDNEVTFVLRDLHPGFNPGRVVHCSQFVIILWQYYRRAITRICYKDASGVLRTTIQASKNTMESVVTEAGIEWDNLLQGIEFIHEKQENNKTIEDNDLGCS